MTDTATNTVSEQDDELDLDGARVEAEALAKLADLPIEAVIQAGHEAMLRLLVAKVAAGTIKHQELATLRNMLRDNGMTLIRPTKEPVKALPLPDDMPRLEEPDYSGQG